jgi:MFS family permease
MDEHQPRYEGWPVVAACSVGAFFATVPLNSFPVFLKPVADHFSWSRESASSAFGTLTLVAALSAPCLGWILDRFGARRVIVPCLAISGLAVASLSLLTSSLWHLRAIFGVIGLATMGASPIAYSRAIFGWFDAHRGRALGVMLAGAAISGIVVPQAAQALIRAADWRIAWLVLGCGTLLIAVPTAFSFVRDRSPSVSETRLTVPAGASVQDAIRSRVFWTLTVVVFGGTIATVGATVHIVALLSDRGVPVSQAALAVSAMGAASLLGRLLTGWLIDRFAAVRVSALLLTIAALGTFLLAGANSLGAGILAAVCIGFGAGGEMDVTPYLLARHFGMRSVSTLYGLTWTAWGLAGAAGPILLGRAFDMTGSYANALIELGAITLTTAALMLTMPSVPSPHSSARPAPVLATDAASTTRR